MHLLVVHYHWRPGGVRQVVETAVARLAADPQSPVRRLVLAAGEPPPADWARRLDAAAGPRLLLEWVTDPWFAYASEWPGGPADHRDAVTDAATRLLRSLPEPRAVLLENPAVGRHPWISHAFAQASTRTGTRLLCHHHDFFPDGRWSRWPEWISAGHPSWPEALDSALPSGPLITHLAVTARDTAWLSHRVPTVYCPNPVAQPAPPSAEETDRTRAWYRQALGTPDPVWLCPTRVLRRKNLAEAVLLARLLAPDALVVTTAGVSSPDEAGYAQALTQASERGDFRLRLGLRHAAETSGQSVPSLPSLMAASDRVVVCSLFEGFGLPVLEASALGLRCVARTEACPDGRPPAGVNAYNEVWIPWPLCGGKTERARQESAWSRWRRMMPPEAVAALPDPPWWSDLGRIPFSRLTLQGQLDTLRACHDPSTADALRSINPGLDQPTTAPQTRPTDVPSPTTLADMLRSSAPPPPTAASAPPHRFLDNRLAWANHYPLLWPGGDAPPS